MLRQGRDMEIQHRIGRAGPFGHRGIGDKSLDAVGPGLAQLRPFFGVGKVLAQDQVDRVAVLVIDTQQVIAADVLVNLVGACARGRAQAHHLPFADPRRLVLPRDEIDRTGKAGRIVAHIVARQRHTNGGTYAYTGACDTHANRGRNDAGGDAVAGIGIDGDVATGRDVAVMHACQGIAQNHVERGCTGATHAYAGATATQREGDRSGQAKHLDVGIGQGLHRDPAVGDELRAVDGRQHRSVDDVARQGDAHRDGNTAVAAKCNGQRSRASKGANR